jgi:hypothetical protein
MSLGDLVVSLSANTARFESDMGKANQITEKWANAYIKNAQQAEKAIKQLGEVGRTSMDSLQRSFNTLDIKSHLQIDREADNIRSAFKRIEQSGVATFDEIKRAKVAMDRKLSDLSGDGNMMKGHIEGMNGFSLASVAAIAKIQILYSLINQTMSMIGSIPSVSIDAIENYKASVISNAAVITSMQGGVKDVGKAYQENKVYAEALEHVLIRMDTETSASYEQLQLMNTAFISQGAILDINNAKAVEGYKSVAQAISVIAKMSNNPNQQFTQEAKALFSGEMKAGNQLLNILAGIDPKIKEHLELWKQEGTVFENLNPLLKGYAAAQGDIDNMWQTITSTMKTIRDEVLRGGLSGGFQEILDTMKQMSKYASENKEKIQAFLRDGFADIKSVAGFIWNMRDGIKAAGEVALWAGVLYGIGNAVLALNKLKDAIVAINLSTSAGFLPKILALGGGAVAGAGGMITGAAILGKGAYDISKAQDEADLIKSHLGPKDNKDALGGPALMWMRQIKPLASTTELQRMYQQGIFKPVDRLKAGEDDSPYDSYNAYRMSYDKTLDDKLSKTKANPKVPKVKVPNKDGDMEAADYTDRWNSYVTALQAFENKGEGNSYVGQIKKIDDQLQNLIATYNGLDVAHKKAADAIRASDGGAIAYFQKVAEKEKHTSAYLDLQKTYQAGNDLAASDKAIFAINNTIANADLPTKRYNVTNPLNRQRASLLNDGEMDHPDYRAVTGAGYRLMTNKSYGISQHGVDPEIAAKNAETVKGFNSGMDSAIKSANGDTHGAAKDGLLEDQAKREKAIKDMLDKGVMNVEQADAAKIKSNQLYADAKKKLDIDTGKQAIGSLANSLETIGSTLMKGNKEQFEAGKKVAIAGATVQMMLGAVNAYTAMTPIPIVGPALGALAATAVVASGLMNISQINSQQFPGREFGGPVTAGQTYVVGEKRPELFTPGVSGHITPYVPEGKGESSITMVNNFAADMADTVRAEISRALPMIRAQAVMAVRGAQRSGQMA